MDYGMVGAVRPLPSGGSRIEGEVRMPYPLRVFFLCLPAVLLLIASETPVARPGSLDAWIARGLLPAVDFSCGVRRTHRFFEELIGGRLVLEDP